MAISVVRLPTATPKEVLEEVLLPLLHAANAAAARAGRRIEDRTISPINKHGCKWGGRRCMFCICARKGKVFFFRMYFGVEATRDRGGEPKKQI
jgi:hypothetical protein